MALTWREYDPATRWRTLRRSQMKLAFLFAVAAALLAPAPSGSLGPSGDTLDESQGQGGAMEPDPTEDIR